MLNGRYLGDSTNRRGEGGREGEERDKGNENKASNAYYLHAYLDYVYNNLFTLFIHTIHRGEREGMNTNGTNVCTNLHKRSANK